VGRSAWELLWHIEKFIFDTINEGKDVILDIDPQGARQLRAKLKCGVYIFIVAPSIKDLKSG